MIANDFDRDHSDETREQGYVLLSFLLLMAISVLIMRSSLSVSATNARTIYATKQRAENFINSEAALSRSLNWLRTNSQNMITPLQGANFYTSFVRTAPSIGSNDTGNYAVPTKIKTRNTSNSVILSTADTIVSQNFPASSHISTGTAFSSTTAFRGTDMGESDVRVTLVDALAVDPSKDYGPPPAAAPETDFYPIYRIDSMTELERGAHVLGYVVGSLTYIDVVGFYGRDFVEMRQPCDSYISANGAYSAASKRANCPVGSNGQIRIHSNTKLYGTARTNGSISSSSPWGGSVCTNFVSGCPNPGTTCQGPSCGVPALPTFSPWATYCPTNQGNRNVNSNQTWVLGGSAPSQNCWGTVSIGSNRTLTLTSTNAPYFIDTLTLQNNSNSRLSIAPNPSNGIVTIYVRNITGNSLNGNQLFNPNNRPSQLRLYYLGTSQLTLNGTAAINASMVSPYAGVDVSGNFEYQGGLLATNLTFTGSGGVHYDESLGGKTLSDVTYRLREEMQRYK